MTGIQSRDESVGNSSDDEPLSKMVKPGKKCSGDPPSSDFLEDVSPKKTGQEPSSSADDCPGHSSDDEPLSKLIDSKGSNRSSKQQETGKLLDSEDDQPLTKIIKKKQQKQKADTEELEDARKTRSPKKRKAVTKAPKLRESSPSPSPSSSPVKFTQRKGRKGKNDSKKKASAQPTAANATPKRRERAKKEAVCGDSSGGEASSELLRKRSEPAMKQAVVLLERMSERDVRDAVARGRAHGQERKDSSDEEPLNQKMKRLKEQRKSTRGRRPPAATADASSDDEPLVRKVKTAKVKDKFRKRANGEEDMVKQDKELNEEDKQPD